jgi:hypothetical protein
VRISGLSMAQLSPSLSGVGNRLADELSLTHWPECYGDAWGRVNCQCLSGRHSLREWVAAGRESRLSDDTGYDQPLPPQKGETPSPGGNVGPPSASPQCQPTTERKNNNKLKRIERPLYNCFGGALESFVIVRARCGSCTANRYQRGSSGPARSLEHVPGLHPARDDSLKREDSACPLFR